MQQVEEGLILLRLTQERAIARLLAPVYLAELCRVRIGREQRAEEAEVVAKALRAEKIVVRLVLLGSPIVGGAPLQPVIKALSFGAGGALEKDVQKNLDDKKADAAAPAAKPGGAQWRRTHAPSPGMPNHSGPRPYGIAFTTYGGGFYGPNEAEAVLATLKQYLNLNNVDVIGRFSCAGKETGPAGYPVGVKPKADFVPGKRNDGPDADVCDAVMYQMADGSLRPGSYFFHYDCESKPGPREEAKARAFMSDVIEDYFMTFDGTPNPPYSEILSLS